MVFQPGAMSYAVAVGASPNDVAYPHIDIRDPTASDVNYPIGKRWVNTVTNIVWDLTSQTSLGGVLSSVWSEGGNADATTSSFGIVQLATLSELQNGNAPAGAYVPTSNDVATVIAGIVVGAVPPATETQAGIAEIATQAETDAGLDDTRIVTPLKLANFVGGGGSPGSFTDLTATGTVTFTGATGALLMTSATASSLGVTGAGIDLTLSSAAGRVVVNGEEAADDAVRVLSAAGGLDVNVAKQLSLNTSENSADSVEIISGGGMDLTASGGAGLDTDIVNTSGSINITAGENAADSIKITSSLGGIDITTTTSTAGEDIDITANGSSVNLTATENAALAIFLHANGGTSETIQVRADQGTGAASVELLSDVGGVTLTGGAASATAINLTTTNAAGGITMTVGTAGILPSTTGKFTVVSTSNSAQAIELHANGGTSETVRLRADQGTGVASIDILSDVGGVTIAGGLGTANAINLEANTAGGGIDIDSSTGGFDVLTTGAISLDSSLASNLTVTGAAVDLTVSSVGGSVVITGTEAAVDAVQINATTALGGVDINAGTGGITIDSTGAFSIDGAAASNVTVTGAGVDLLLSSSLGSVLVESTENAALAIRLHANGGTSETIQIHSDQGTGVGSVNILSDVGGITLTATGLASADAINLEAPAGGLDINAALEINIDSSQAAATALNLIASGATGGITMTAGSGGLNGTTTGTISIGANAQAQTANFNTGAAAKVTNIGSTNTTSATVINSGSGLITMAGKVALNSAAGPQVLAGAGDPNALVTAPQGSLWLRTDGSSTSTRAYINTNAGTVWTAITTVA